jgi:hypothetical protein
MAKKKAAGKKVAKKSAKKSGKKKAAKAKRRNAGKPRRVPLHRASKAARARVMRGFKRVLAEYAIAGDVAAVHFDLAGTPWRPPERVLRAPSGDWSASGTMRGRWSARSAACRCNDRRTDQVRRGGGVFRFASAKITSPAFSPTM